MSLEPKSRTSISLHPDTVTKLEGFSEDTRGYIAGTERALHEAYSGVSAVHAAMDAAKRDPTLNDAARVIKVDDLARRVFKKIAGLFDAERLRLEKGIALAEEKLTAPVEAKASHSMASEIRAFVLGMVDDRQQPSDAGSALARVNFIRAAILEGDDLTASSCLGGRHYLCGIDKDMHSVLLRTYHERRAPDEAARLKVMQGAKALIEHRGGLLFTELEKAVGARPDEVRRLREAKTASDEAFAA